MLSKASRSELTGVGPLRSREDTQLPERIARSASATGGTDTRSEEIVRWLTESARTAGHRVDRIAFDELEGWSFEKGTGNLTHHTGRFFRVEGLSVRVSEGPFREWRQPIISQPEIGILGILAKEFDGVLHFLMQAKMEPGNPNLVQLSPTVQATRSNYTRVHRGTKVEYIDYFVEPGRGRVLVDVLQSEHGSWFYRKRNRNMVVETREDVRPGEGFRWLTLEQIGELLRRDNVVNMDARTVLACLPPVPRARGGQALHSDTELLSWFTGERSRHEVSAELMPLGDVDGWIRGPRSIDHAFGRYFSVVAVAVQARGREVATWTQPLFQPHGTGVAAFLRRSIEGVPHFLVHARAEGGFLDTVELGPTVQCTPDNHAHLPSGEQPCYLDTVLGAGLSQIGYSAIHSEEGGRFLSAQSDYLIVDVDQDEAPAKCPPGYRWITADQLSMLVRYGHHVNVQARTLLACLRTGAVS